MLVGAMLMVSCSTETKTTINNSTSSNSEGTPKQEGPENKHYQVKELVDIDLSSHGVNLTVKAPKDSKIIKSKANKDIFVYGGKFFKLTIANREGDYVENMDMLKDLVSDKKINPSFDKFDVELENGFLKTTTKGKISFLWFIQIGEKHVIINEGMGYDESPDKFTDYTEADIMVMFEAAKASKAK